MRDQCPIRGILRPRIRRWRSPAADRTLPGRTRSGCEVVGVLVAGVVNAVVLAGEMEAPVAVEVAVGLDRAELQDGLGAGQAPAGAADVQAVADQVPTRSLDHPDGDRPAAGQRGVLAEELLFGLEVADAGVDTALLAFGQPRVGGLLVDRGDGLGGPPGQDADR